VAGAGGGVAPQAREREAAATASAARSFFTGFLSIGCCFYSAFA
jgi:hypothetical protein